MSTGPACRQTPHKLLIMRVDINILACLMQGSQQTHSVRRACEWGRYRQRGLNDLLICAGLIWISEPGCWAALLGRWANCKRSVCVCVCRSADDHAWPQKHTLQSCMLFQKAKCLHTDQKFSSCSECFQCCLLISWQITVSFELIDKLILLVYRVICMRNSVGRAKLGCKNLYWLRFRRCTEF